MNGPLIFAAGASVIAYFGLWQLSSSNQACAESDRWYNQQRIGELRFGHRASELERELEYERQWEEWNKSGLIHKAFHSCPSWVEHR